MKTFKKCLSIFLLSIFAVLLPIFFIGCNQKEKKAYVNIPYEYFVQFHMLNDSIYANGREISIAEYNKIIKEIESTLIDISKAVNTTLENSTVSKLNRAGAGEEIAIDNYTKELFIISKQAYDLSGGKFSPALYNLSQIWGFTPEFELDYNKPRPEPTAEAIAMAKANSNFEDFDLSKLQQNIVSKKNTDVKLDFGGIAKGYMADKVQQIIENALPNMQVDCGFSVMSNTVLMGQRHTGSTVRGFNIAVENPRMQVTGGGFAMVIENASNVAISTSADTYRFYSYNGKIYPHIIDYTTGKPADNGVISATVLVPNGKAFASTWTDIYSTLGFCMPLTELLTFYQSQNIGAAVICNDFNYYTVSNTADTYKIVNRAEFNAKWDNYFTAMSVESAVDNFAKSQKEIEYIGLMQNSNRKKFVDVSQAKAM